jgi:hypothetical protein
MIKKSIVYLIIALITLSITNLESKQPKSKYVAVLACRKDSIQQTLYIKKISFKYLHFKFITEDINNKKILFTLKGVGINNDRYEGINSVRDECEGFGESRYGCNVYDYSIVTDKSKQECTYSISVSYGEDRADISNRSECAFIPPGSFYTCIGTLRRIK